MRETRDPILILRQRMIDAGFATDDELKVSANLVFVQGQQ